ncbi:mediator of RNA polymerase II transcription subunit 28 [Anastrepha obliqua]|uniref:mediator of RNA polymerase II transcription subunit 28 n=1 Tax=Anastrepha ludens TaxID=28586 RepID=UPI0023B159BB|nr:mediator of RNA polymerase II transcription subunit 28 [Anastrepha ludens]XP_054738080.1 mediator of RNA polymerase II transcription subunit 28 [Anastrepha obliqua]
MASSSNENGNLMDEFEEAFQACLLSLTKPEPNTGTNKDEIELEVQKTTNRFIDVARQMEAFFLQKRFLVSTLKPDMLIKDENQDLRNEIARKEQLLNKHYSRLEEWKACLSDIQANQGVHNRPIGGVGSTIAAMSESVGMGATGMAGPAGLNIPQGPNRPGVGGMLSNMPAYGVARRF